MEAHEHIWLDPLATERAGAALGACLEAGDLVGLVGDLGAGKTLLVQGIARGLGVPPAARVTSPTFTLINEYHGGRVPLYHADLYRIEHSSELLEIGLDEICRRGDGAVAVEWCDRFDVLGRDYLEVRIQVRGDTERAVRFAKRAVRFAGTGARGQALAAAWAAALQAR